MPQLGHLKKILSLLLRDLKKHINKLFENKNK
jgi:hypothetical protein